MNIFTTISKWIQLKFIETKESIGSQPPQKTIDKYILTGILNSRLVGRVTGSPITKYKRVRVRIEVSADKTKLDDKQFNKLVTAKARNQVRQLYEDQLIRYPLLLACTVDRDWDLEMENIKFLQVRPVPG